MVIDHEVHKTVWLSWTMRNNNWGGSLIIILVLIIGMVKFIYENSNNQSKYHNHLQYISTLPCIIHISYGHIITITKISLLMYS